MKRKFWTKNAFSLLTSQALFLFANNVLYFAISIHILNITKSGVLFGTMTAISVLPMVILMPFGGFLADRVNKKKLLLNCDFIVAVSIIVFDYFIIEKQSLLFIILAMILLLVTETIYSPTIQALIPILFHSSDIVKANAYISQISIATNVFGPVFGGMLYSFLGLSFLLPIGACMMFLAGLFKIQLQYNERRNITVVQNILKEFKTDTINCINLLKNKYKYILIIVLIVATLNLLVTPLVTVGLPYIIEIILGYNTEVYGIAVSITFIGSFIAGVVSSQFSNYFKVEKTYHFLIGMALSILPIGVAFTLNMDRGLLLTCTILFLTFEQFFVNLFSILDMSYIQMLIPEEMIGKVTSFIIMVSICAEPLGRLIYGVLFDTFITKIHIIIFIVSAISLILAIISKPQFIKTNLVLKNIINTKSDYDKKSDF